MKWAAAGAGQIWRAVWFYSVWDLIASIPAASPASQASYCRGLRSSPCAA